ncbi:MAG: hypothetical protein AABW86_03140 [Candidatus Micrarchaeota archaeon]
MKLTKFDIFIFTLILVYVIVLGSATISLLGDINIIFTNKVPIESYVEYVSNIFTYEDRYRSYALEICKIVDSDAESYRVISGNWGNSVETHFFSNGTKICTFSSHIEMRDGVKYYYEKAGCPPIEKCRIILGGS